MDHDYVERTIEFLQNQIREEERGTAEKRRMANSLAGLIGRAPIYTNVEPTQAGTVLRSDEFYGKALTSAARTILERRDAGGLGAASVDALYADLLRGGFQFDAKNDGTAKRSLAISLAKNSYLFHRLPNGDWGLVSWYEKLPPKARSNGGKDEKADRSEVEAAPQDGLAEPYRNEFADVAEQHDGASPRDADHEPAPAPARKRRSLLRRSPVAEIAPAEEIQAILNGRQP